MASRGQHEGENWPYHEDRHGNMVPCASNPCKLHGGSDIIATSAADAEEVRHQGDSFGLGATPSIIDKDGTTSNALLINALLSDESRRDEADGLYDDIMEWNEIPYEDAGLEEDDMEWEGDLGDDFESATVVVYDHHYVIKENEYVRYQDGSDYDDSGWQYPSYGKAELKSSTVLHKTRLKIPDNLRKRLESFM